jgi:predicted chitinase
MSRDANIALIKAACVQQGLTLPAQIAYVLATAEWETAHTMEPVEEAFYLGDKAPAYRKRLKYAPYYGRGFVQLTWRANYRNFSTILSCDLLRHPELALEPERAAAIMAYGFAHGSFTGARLDDFVYSRRRDFRNARRCINGVDCAGRIATMAEAWLEDLASE